MSAFRIALWTVALCAGAGISRFSRDRDRGGPEGGQFVAGAALSGRSGSPGAAGIEAALALTGQRGPVTIDDIFTATGLDRLLRLAAFLTNAQPEDFAALMGRVEADGIDDMTMIDAIRMRWSEVDLAGSLCRPGPYGAEWWAWAKVDPDAAVAAAKEKGGQALQAVVRAIAEVDGARGLALIADDPQCDSRWVREGVVKAVFRSDPAAAAALAMENQAGFEETLNAWMDADAEAALDWARNLENRRDRREALKAAVAHINLTDPAAGLREAMALPAGMAKTSLVIDGLYRLAGVDPEAARDALQKLPAGGARERAILALAAGLAAADPEAAVSLIRDSVEFERDTAMHDSVSSHLDELVDAAPAEMVRLVGENSREGAGTVGRVMRRWLQWDPEAASRWIAAEPPGPVREAAVGALVTWLTDPNVPMQDFEAALEWAAALESENRGYYIRQVLDLWGKRDPVAAADAEGRIQFEEPMALPH